MLLLQCHWLLLLLLLLWWLLLLLWWRVEDPVMGCFGGLKGGEEEHQEEIGDLEVKEGVKKLSS